MFSNKGAMGNTRGAFFMAHVFSALLIAYTGSALAETACSSKYYDEITTVRRVYDGDTLQLSDGRKVRLIGINTPELGRKDKAEEPFSTEAKNALDALFETDKSIALLLGKDKKDRYGRLLAHGFLADGQNIQAALLTQGLARFIAIPPNTHFSACYLAQENKARCRKTGLWQNRKILTAGSLNKQHSGFQLVQGTVKKITSNSKGIWLDIDQKLTVGIRPKDQHLFDITAIKNMLNQSVTIRGWLNNRNKSTPFYIRVRHPLSLQPATALSCD